MKMQIELRAKNVKLLPNVLSNRKTLMIRICF